MRSFISLLLLSGCFPSTDSGSPTMPDSPSMEADAKRCHNRYFRDIDADGYGNSRKMVVGCVQPNGYAAIPGDCDDRNGQRNPGAAEVCDGIDQNCNGLTDEKAVNAPLWYADVDQDGHGDATEVEQTCTQPAHYVAIDDDCDDNDASTFWGAAEVCDNVDNDCNNTVDDSPVDGVAAFPDGDGDGFGLAADALMVCTVTDGFADKQGDCNDGDSSIFPGAREVCDLVDQNCDGTLDENPLNAPPWFPDADKDGHASPSNEVYACTAPADMLPITAADDCDDGDGNIFPGAREVCDTVDNDCDGQMDENPVDGRTWFADLDGDGFGDARNTAIACSLPSGYSLNELDCDDSDAGLPVYVDGSGSGGGSGSLADPMTSIQSAVDSGASCILLASVTFQEDLDLSNYQGVIESINGSSYTTVEGLGAGPVITLSSAAVTLRGVTITGGGAPGWSFVEGENGEACVGTLESHGGGVMADSSTLAMEDVVLTGNDILGVESPRPECSNYAVSMGGGIAAPSSDLILDEVMLSNNGAAYGSAMALIDSTVAASRVVVTSTATGHDSDLYLIGGSFTVNNMLVAGSSSVGLSASESTVSLSQAMFADYEVAVNATGTVTLTNSLFMDNDSAVQGAATWAIDYCDSFNNGADWGSGVGIGNLSADPMLTAWSNDGDMSNDNFSLESTSPLIDAGSPAILDVDGSVSDIGPMGGPDGW